MNVFFRNEQKHCDFFANDLQINVFKVCLDVPATLVSVVSMVICIFVYVCLLQM